MNSTFAYPTITFWLFCGLVLTVSPIPGGSFVQENSESLSNDNAPSEQIDDLFQAHPLPGTTASTTTLYLGEERVWVHIHEGPAPGLTLVNIHDDENTALEAAQLYIRDNGGRLVELRHGRGREVVIRRGGVLNRFDPNRMFTENGLRHSLQFFGNFSDENYAIAATFARTVTTLIGIEKDKVIIGVHNNTPDKLTIKDFKPGQLYGKDTREVFINPAEDHDDFIFTNSAFVFNALKAKGYNAALTAADPPDRGTLGNFVNSAGGIYVLVEVEHGHLTRQLNMLEDIGRLITEEHSSYSPTSD